MNSSSNRNTLIALAAGIIVAIVLEIAGLSWSTALIIGGLVAIAAWFLAQRMGRAAESDGGTGGAGEGASAADIDAMMATATASVDGFISSTAEIANPSTQQIATKIGTNFQSIMTELEKPENRASAPTVIDNLIEPAQSVMTEYLFLTKRAVATSTPRATTIEQSTFPSIESASRQTLSLLQEPGSPDLAKVARASTVPFEQGVTVPPGGTTPKGSREIQPNDSTTA